MTHLTSSPPSRRSRCLDLFASTALLAERGGSPTFTSSLLLHAMLSDSEVASHTIPIVGMTDVAFWEFELIGLPNDINYGAQSLQPRAYGLQYSCLRL